MDTKEKTTALYIRVSTDFQFEEGYSVEAQQDKLRQWCKLKDISKYEFYIDGGWSGSNLKRPEISRLIQDILSDRISAVVVYKLDRLSRSQKDTIYLLEDIFIPHGVDFISLNENFDTSTPYGKAMIGILSVFAQLERENIRDRTRMGMHERVKKGSWMGGATIPFGYDYDREQDKLVPNEHAGDVKKIFELYLQGYSTTQLASMFDVANDTHIARILDRVTYLGKIPYKGEIYDGNHAPLVSEELWNKVQAERKRRSTKSQTMSHYLLTGLVYCGKCNSKMRYQKWGKKLKIYCYSQLKSKPQLIKDPNCDNMRYDAEQVESLVLADLFDACDRIVAHDTKPVRDTSGLDVLITKRKMLREKIKRLYNLFAEQNSDLLLETIRENQEELQSVETNIERIKMQNRENYEPKIDKELIRNLRNTWEYLSFLEKRDVLCKTIEKIILTDGAVDVRYNF